MSSAWIEAERRANRELVEQRRERAKPDCHICSGTGETRGYIAPMKYTTYACPCTGMADWQRKEAAS